MHNYTAAVLLYEVLPKAATHYSRSCIQPQCHFADLNFVTNTVTCTYLALNVLTVINARTVTCIYVLKYICSFKGSIIS